MLEQETTGSLTVTCVELSECISLRLALAEVLAHLLWHQVHSVLFDVVEAAHLVVHFELVQWR